MLEEGKAISKIAKEVNITRQTVYRIKMVGIILINGLLMQMRSSHSVLNYMLFIYYEILIIRQERECEFALSFCVVLLKFCLKTNVI